MHHDRNAIGPYAFKGDQWVGFDDVAMIRRKSEFVKANGYGGGMIWALDLDDFANVCNCEEYPLLRTINRVLRNYPLGDPKCDAKSYQAEPQSGAVSYNDPFQITNPFGYAHPDSKHNLYSPVQPVGNSDRLYHYQTYYE